MIPVPLDPNLTPREVAVAEEVTSPVAVLGPDEVTALAARRPDLGTPRARPLHLTSGTTGRPKAVWSGLLDDAAAAALVAEERDLWGFSPDDVHLVLGPLHHSAPLRFAVATRLAGGQVLAPGRFDPAVVTDLVRHERPTTTFCVPTHLRRLADSWGGAPPRWGSLRLLAHAGAACPPDLKRWLLDTLPPGTTWEFYGSTEGQFTACRSEEQVDRPGTVGRARPGRRLRADPDGTLWCAVPEHARFTYLDDPERTASTWREGPHGPEFTVGDHGRLDEDGYVFLDGRREDLIVSGGVNVYPAEVEQVLAGHPGVREVAVYGVPDPQWGQRVCAAVVGEVDPDVLRAWARERLAPAKRPKDYVGRDALPMTRTGKVRRHELSSPPGRSGDGTAAG
nr:fatty acid--CoA ligase family protein [Nocardioides sp. HDW12B]